ncbi:MAG: agmatinase [Candidatus Aenigmatarchaeota archaeon]
MDTPNNFFGLAPEFCDKKSKVVILSVPFEGTVTYGKGTALGPEAIKQASRYLELYDEEIEKDIFEIGITTAEPVDIDGDNETVINNIKNRCKEILDTNKFLVVVGGEHLITLGCYRALKERYSDLSVIQFDAHADLRDHYDGEFLNHACVMARIRESCDDVLQVGIRSLCWDEAEAIKKNKYNVLFAKDTINNIDIIKQRIDKLGNNVFITIDVDFFDWSVVDSTGTPEPGGFDWYKSVELFRYIFENKNVVGFDVVELCGGSGSERSAFAMAKLIYKLIGYRFFMKN